MHQPRAARAPEQRLPLVTRAAWRAAQALPLVMPAWGVGGVQRAQCLRAVRHDPSCASELVATYQEKSMAQHPSCASELTAQCAALADAPVVGAPSVVSMTEVEVAAAERLAGRGGRVGR